MLIVNADDWGGWPAATNATLECYQKGSITSVSAMVFMEDSERAAALAKQLGMSVGLHLNFSQEFTSNRDKPAWLVRAHQAVVRFLRLSKYSLLLYNPVLRKQFRQVFDAQVQEFLRLYGRPPSHYDGHQHMHLCSNMLLDRVLPEGQRVRRSFSFGPGEKSLVNRVYRRLVDRQLARRHRLTDYFFALSQQLHWGQFDRTVGLARSASVELMVHPEWPTEKALLNSEAFGSLLQAQSAEFGDRAANKSTEKQPIGLI